MQFNADGPVTLGYLFLTVVCVLFALSKPEPRTPEDDEAELAAGEESWKSTSPAS